MEARERKLPKTENQNRFGGVCHRRLAEKGAETFAPMDISKAGGGEWAKGAEKMP